MKFSLILSFMLFFIACSSKTSTEDVEPHNTNYSLESVELAINISSKIENNQSVNQSEWNALFDSRGYQNYFCAFDRNEIEPKLKEAYQIVFNEHRSKELDSLLKAPVPMDASGQYNMIVSNLNRFKINKKEIESFIANTDFELLMEDAKKQTFEYLPKFAKDTIIPVHSVNFILMEPGAYVTDCGIVVDINHAFENGQKELQSLFAHEYHHDYRNAFISIPNDALMRELNDIQAEGIADFIDKQLPPWNKMQGFPQSMVEEFNAKFKDTPKKLAELDLLTSSFVSGQISKADFDTSLDRFFWDGGHANGFYMSIKIVEAGLKEQIIETFNRPVEFIKLYNEAVKDQPEEHVFSIPFLDYITKLQTDYDNHMASLSDETFEVTFKIKVPRESDQVFIAGNQEALGNWKPDAIKMNVVSALEREITLSISAPAEFKFTRGNWKTEALFGNDQDNLKLTFQGDTTSYYVIEKWIDDSENNSD